MVVLAIPYVIMFKLNKSISIYGGILMTQKWEKHEGNEGTLTFTVPSEDFEKGLDEAFKKVSKDVSLPGFRKGKIPRKMFESRFGVESLYQDALDFVLPDAYRKAIDAEDINPIDQPEIDIEEIERGKDVVLTAKIQIEPEVKLGEYKGLKVDELDTEVTDEDVENEINAMLESHSDMVIKEDGEIENGDLVKFDFDGYVDGEAFDGGKAEDYELEIGSGNFIPGFEEGMLGLKVDDEKDVLVTFPEDYHAEHLAGKEATFKVKVHSIKAKEVPELDEELLKELDKDVSSVEELRESVLKDLQAEKETARDNKLREDLIMLASDNSEVDIPEVMVKNETDRMVQEFSQNLAQQGLNFEMYQQFSGQDEKALREQMKDDARKRVKTNLTLKQIAIDENFEVTDEELNAEAEKMARQFNMSVEDIKRTLGDLSMLKDDLRLQKVVSLLVDSREQ